MIVIETIFNIDFFDMHFYIYPRSSNEEFSNKELLQISSNINEAIKATLNSFIQKLENHKKAQNGHKQTKIKNAPKNI